MKMKTKYRIPRQLCDAISSFAEAAIGKLTKRPWNRFNPDYTSWWLVPNTKIPHFKHGKYYFNWGDKKQTTLLAGLYLEKGLDEKIASVYSSKKAKSFIMTPDWNWFKFLEGLKNKQPFDNLKNNCPPSLPIEFIIDGGYVTEPTSFDPYQEKTLAWDQYAFTWHPESDEFSLTSSNRKAFILKFHHVKTIDDFIKTIIEYSKDDWLWMNIHIAIRLEISSSPDEKDIWNESEIWKSFLSSFSDLIE